MFLDASAIIAILARESEGPVFVGRVAQADRVRTSPIAIYEAVLGLARVGNMPLSDAEEVLDRLLSEIDAEIVPVTGLIARGAIRAFERYGKGRHPAGLNMGDCFAYACAQDLDAQLVFKGNDFSQTDAPTFGT